MRSVAGKQEQAEERLRILVTSGALGALALLLPVAFHAVGLGSKFLPMLLPLLLNGFLVPPGWAATVGLLVPWVSTLATGMPPLYPPVVAVVSAEGAVLGGVAGLLYRRLGTGLWVALVTAVLAGRLTAWASSYVLAKWFGLPAALASVAMLVQGLPGVALQMAVVPFVVRVLEQRDSVLLGRDRKDRID